MRSAPHPAVLLPGIICCEYLLHRFIGQDQSELTLS